VSIYRYTKKPYVIGRVHHKAWSALLPPEGEYDPVWAKRAKDYWELQQETFGVKFSDFTMSVDWDAHVVVTYAMLLDVLPGERRVDYVVPRIREERQRRAALHG
jgi:hypothetical protein